MAVLEVFFAKFPKICVSLTNNLAKNLLESKFNLNYF